MSRQLCDVATCNEPAVTFTLDETGFACEHHAPADAAVTR